MAENKPSTILWGLCWKTAEISAVFQQLVFGRFPTTQNVSAVFQQRGFGRFPTIFFGHFPHPRDETLENLCMIDCAVNAHVNHDPLPFFISISFFSLTFYESGISLNIFESTFFQIPKNKAQPS